MFLCITEPCMEIRAIIYRTENAKTVLREMNAVYQGDYVFKDCIYSKDQIDLNPQFVRVRQYQKTQWQQKLVVISHKIRDIHGSKTLSQIECNTREEAIGFIPKEFNHLFSFSRKGWEYTAPEAVRIFIEEIDGLPPSVEIIAQNKESIHSLFSHLGVIEILSDSVPEWYRKRFSPIELS